jgi:hypothetical protein
VLTPSDALVDMYPVLRRMAEQKRDVVLHVAAMRVCGGIRGEALDPLTVRSDLTDLFIAGDSGLAVILSSNAQESHDIAIAAHLAARRASTPVAHAFDGVVGTRHQTNDAVLLPSAAFAALLDGAVEKRATATDFASSAKRHALAAAAAAANAAASSGARTPHTGRLPADSPLSAPPGAERASLTSAMAARNSMFGTPPRSIALDAAMRTPATPQSPAGATPPRTAVFHRLAVGATRDAGAGSDLALAIRAALAVGPGGVNGSAPPSAATAAAALLGARKRASADDVLEAFEWSLARVAALTGRRHALVEYTGAADADTVVVAPATADSAALARAAHRVGAVGAVGVLKVRLLWPFPARAFVQALPAQTKVLVVTECCSATTYGKLRLAVVAALRAHTPSYSTLPLVIGGVWLRTCVCLCVTRCHRSH